MKSKSADTYCPCGTALTVTIKKPGVGETIRKHACKYCASKFLIKCWKAKGGYHVSFDLLELSEFAKHVVEWRIANENKPLPSQRNFWGLLAWIFGQFQV